VYLGAYCHEEDAARTWDIAALKWGLAPLNFPRSDYAAYEAFVAGASRDQVVAWLKGRSGGYSHKKKR